MLRAPFPRNDDLQPINADWDLSWVDRVSAPHKVVFDSPEVNEGGALFRAVLWRDEYQEVFGTPLSDTSTVLVLRHNGIALAMDDNHWERFEIGKEVEWKAGRDESFVTRNPISAAPADARAGAGKYTIKNFAETGGIILACNLAFNANVIPKYRTEGVSREDARAEALKHLLPNVILQPSGFFAVIRAQEAGCQLFPG
jgi:hypothetical protein